MTRPMSAGGVDQAITWPEGQEGMEAIMFRPGGAAVRSGGIPSRGSSPLPGCRPSWPGRPVIQGEAGIGKTTVWSEGVTAAHRTTYTVMSCALHRRGRGLTSRGPLISHSDFSFRRP